MLKIAIYGKGGIGKSTVTSNLAAAFAVLGKKVIQIGCDPKADSTINLLEDLELFETCQPDVVLYDVLGDVVCGGFAAPIREGYAEKVLIVTSGEKMALYAANNINSAVKNFEDRSYAKVFGIVMNRRNVEKEEEKVRAFADSVGLPIVGDIPRDHDINRFEDMGKTVIEGDPELPISKRFLDLAKMLLETEETGKYPGDQSDFARRVLD